MKDNVTLRHVKNYFLEIKIDNCPTQRSLLFNYKPKKNADFLRKTCSIDCQTNFKETILCNKNPNLVVSLRISPNTVNFTQSRFLLQHLYSFFTLMAQCNYNLNNLKHMETCNYTETFLIFDMEICQHYKQLNVRRHCLCPVFVCITRKLIQVKSCHKIINQLCFVLAGDGGSC